MKWQLRDEKKATETDDLLNKQHRTAGKGKTVTKNNPGNPKTNKGKRTRAER